MPQTAPKVNPGTSHETASLHALALLILPGNLDRVRDRLDPAWAHPRHREIYRAIMAVPAGTGDILAALPQDQAVQAVQLTADVTTPPASVETALTWLHSAWAEAEMGRAWMSGDPARVKEIFERTQAGPKTQSTPWDRARSRFPRRPVPWEGLPGSIAASLQQLARSCATSPTALPGAAMCILASVIGRNVSVSPKASWSEPLIFWTGDIRKSGQGKTPPARKLSEVITHKWQVQSTERYEQAKAVYDALPKKEREGTAEPDPPHSYYLTSLTMEGIRDQMVGHPTGGLVAIQDELSAMIAGQNEYKSRGGSDREAWLCLHDGHPARIARAGKIPITITGARVQVFGGIQPEIFRRAFGGNGGTYLHDGTLYRFLLTFDRDNFYELTAESWDHKYQQAWEDLLERARQWTMAQGDHLQLVLGQEAQARFLEWANEIKAMMPDLPEVLQGYVPKAVGYALRLTGILHLMGSFEANAEPRQVLGLDDVEAGIQFVEFYMGQAVDAMRYLTVDQAHVPAEITDRDRALCQVLEALRGEVDNGRLAVGYIRDKFNAICKPEQKISSPHAMGGWLRSLGLKLSNGKHSANGRRTVKCLLWDDSLENCLKSLSCLQNHGTQGLTGSDIDQAKSELSATQSEQVSDMQTIQTYRHESLHPETPTNSRSGDNADNSDNFPERKKQSVEI